MPSPSTKPMKSRCRRVVAAQRFSGVLHRLDALHFLDADIEQSDGRLLQIEQNTAPWRCPSARATQMILASAPIEAPRSSTMNSPPQRRPDRARWPGLSTPSSMVQIELGHRHQRAGVAGRDADIGFAALDRIEREPHRRHASSVAQRLARFVVHLDGDIGMDDARDSFQRGVFVEFGLNARGIADQEKLRVRVTLLRQRAPGITTEGQNHPPWRPARYAPCSASVPGYPLSPLHATRPCAAYRHPSRPRGLTAGGRQYRVGVL